MLRKVLNKIFSSRIFYILFSLIASIALWMYVEITVNDEDWHEVSNVPIEFINRDLLRDRKFFFSQVTQNLTLNFFVPRAVAAQLTSSSVSAVVDLESVTRTGVVYAKYEISLPSGVAIDPANISRSVGSIALNVDRLSSASIDVRVDYRGGTASEDLFVETVIFDPQTITVSGPEDALSKIRYARVSVPRESLASTYTDDLDFTLQDENGEELSDELLNLIDTSFDSIHVTIPIKQIKKLYLNIEFAHGSGTNDQNTTYEIVPQYVTVSGDPEVLKEYNNIPLRTINTTTEDFRAMNVTLTRGIVYPNGVTPLSGETEAQVNIAVSGLIVRIYSVTNLFWTNKPADHRVEWITQSIDVAIRGRREDLELITAENIRVVADLKDVPLPSGAQTATTQRVNAAIHVDGISADIGAIDSYPVYVRIIREE